MEEQRFDTVTAAESGTPENRDDVERAAEIVAGLGDTGPLRSAAAVIVGFVVLTLGSVLASRLIGLAAAGGGTTGATAAEGSSAAPPALGAGLVWANLASRLLVTVLAGAATARAAPRRPLLHALVLAAFVTLISVASLFGLRAAGQFGDPAWYPVAMLFVGPAGILLGGWLPRRSREASGTGRGGSSRTGAGGTALILFGAAAVAAVSSGCGGTEAGRLDAGVRDSAGIRIVDNGRLGPGTCAVSPTPSLDLGVVEGEKEYQLYRVFDAATLSDGRIAVVNQGSGQIRLYSAEGAFDRAFGSEGDGPGEFRRVFQISVTPADTLLVGDYRPYRYSIFTGDGEFVRAVVPEPPYVNNPEFIAPMSDGTFLAAAEDHVMPERQGEWPAVTQFVILHGPDGSVLDTLASLPYGHTGWLDQEIGFMGRPLFEPISLVTAAGTRIVIGPGDVRELSLFELPPPIDVERPSMIVRWSGDDLAVTEADIDDYRRRVLDNAGESATPMSRRFADASISGDRPISERFPAYGALAIGLGGDIWVEEYARGEEPADRAWLVFEPDGRFGCHARLPFRYSWDLYEIGPDYVLGKVEDELGVEHVRRYALRRP